MVWLIAVLVVLIAIAAALFSVVALLLEVLRQMDVTFRWTALLVQAIRREASRARSGR